MARTHQSSIAPQFLILASFAAVIMSCGPQNVGDTIPAVQPSIEPPALRVTNLAMLQVPTDAIMTRIDDSLIRELRAALEGLDEEPQEDLPVDVSFRLGPKMASRSFAIGRDGSMDPAELKKLRRMFRCRRSGRTHRIHQGLLAKIADLASHYEGHTLEVISAYRHGKNAKPTSRHRQGRAIDIRVVGVPAARVRDYLWTRYQEEVGVGFYQEQQFVHLDHRNNSPAIAWTQKHHSDQNEYHPGWARSSRRSKLVVALAED